MKAPCGHIIDLKNDQIIFSHYDKYEFAAAKAANAIGSNNMCTCLYMGVLFSRHLLSLPNSNAREKHIERQTRRFESAKREGSASFS